MAAVGRITMRPPLGCASLRATEVIIIANLIDF